MKIRDQLYSVCRDLIEKQSEGCDWDPQDIEDDANHLTDELLKRFKIYPLEAVREDMPL